MSDAVPEKPRAFTQAEHVLKDSERLLRAVWEYATDAIALSTPDGAVIAANQAYFHLYGFPPEEVIGKRFSIFVPEEQRKMADELYDYIFQSPAISPSFVGPIRRADGRERFVESRYTFITHDGQRIAMLSFVRDLTERKRLEEAVSIHEEKLRLALEVGHVDSWDWDIESNVIQWSAPLQAAFGLVRDDTGVSYTTFIELIHPPDRTQVDQAMKSACEEGTDFTVEFRARLADGTIHRMRLHGQALHNEAGKPMRMIGISMDITQHGRPVSETDAIANGV